MVLLVLPAKQVRYAPDAYTSRAALLHRWADEHGVTCVDPQLALDSTSGPADLYLDELHLGRDGHAQVAKALSNALRNRSAVFRAGSVGP